MSQKKEFCGLDYVRLLCFLAAFHPNCTRCCPVGFGSCQCEWAWEDCPQQQGCNDCSGTSASALTSETEAGTHAQSVAPALDASADAVASSALADREDERGGTLAFVVTDAGTFGVASIAARDRVRIMRVDANKLDEDPLTVRTTSDIAMRNGDAPSRVVSDGRGRALVALRRGGAIATIDPLLGSIVARTNVCTTPIGLALDEPRGAFHVACASGDVVTVRLSDDVETTRASVGAALADVAIIGDEIAVTSGSRIFTIDPRGVTASRDAFASVLRSTREGAFMASAPITDVALDADRTAIVSDGEAFLRTTARSEFVRVGGPGLTRAVALGNVGGEGVTRRILSLQTVSPRMLVLFVGDASPMAAAFEPLE